ncbi:hypothetical protein CFP56_030430 [Quercus suber]|uniref:Uncharacterized protein n=1 Tax=Quercus suber TaxID=58331 RepID=A0AAW0JNG7_QUESU
MGNLEKDTALHDAVRNDHFDIIELLIRELPRLTSLTNNAGESPLFLAVDRAFYKISPHILEEAANVPGCLYGGRNKMNVLHVAVIGTGQVCISNYKNHQWKSYYSTAGASIVSNYIFIHKETITVDS